LPAAAREPALTGAAIEVRLYAEDPVRDWLPQAGRLDAFTIEHQAAFGSVRGVRLDAGVETSNSIGVFYDPMLAKVIAWAPDRSLASALLASTLRRAEISGIVTNRDLLVRVLESSSWLAGDTDTDFFERVGLAALAAPLVGEGVRPQYVLAAALGQAALRRRQAAVLGGLPSGWRNNPSQPQAVWYVTSDAQIEVQYACSRSGLSARVDGEEIVAAVLSADPGDGGRVDVVLEVDLVRRAYSVHVVSAETPAAAGPVARVHVSGPEGAVTFEEIPRFPEPSAQVAAGSLTAAMPGSVVRVLVGEGDVVTAGQPILVLEAMKMEHTVAAPAGGTVTSVAVVVGSQVETGSLLAVVGD
jgi:propionyl-CoA carboxylase alpha chain